MLNLNKIISHSCEYIKITIVLLLQIIWIQIFIGNFAMGVPSIQYGHDSLNDNIDDLSSLPIIDTSYDLDTEQSEARYDPRLLSEELRGSHTASKQGAEACIGKNGRYDHGQKITRLDPCEICLCVDGEIFCWWKQCDYTIKKNKYNYNMKQQKQQNLTPKKKIPRPIYSTKPIKYIPQSILKFPQNLPGHLTILNDTIMNSDTVYPIIYNSNSANNNIINQTSTLLIAKETTKTKKGLFQITTAVAMTSANKTSPATSDKTLPDSLLNKKLQINTTSAKKGSTFNNSDSHDGNFIESIQKISSPSTVLDSKNDFNENKLRKIKIDDFGVGGQHYVITSSGHVEQQTDVLASDNVLEQFRNIPSSGSGPSVSGSSSSRGSGDEYNYKYITENRKNTTDMENINHKNQSSIQDINNGQTNSTKYNTTDVTQTTTSLSASSASTILSSQSIITTASSTPIEQNCIVMGISYKIGSVLPQETGNCLQCICIESVNQNEPPRVTCNPHNCPPLVLPDLFDTTGY